MKKLLFLITFCVGGAFLLIIQPVAVKAGACFSDPVAQYDWDGKITSAVFMRDAACMEGSKVLGSIPGGTAVHIFGETDGWYYVEWNGGRAWVGASFVTVTAKRFAGNVFPTYDGFMQKFPAIAPSGSSSPEPITESPSQTSEGTFVSLNADLVGRTKGYILLQTQSHGEAWYVDPITSKRYYMKDGSTAYQMMRSFGLGISEADYQKMTKGDVAIKSRLQGRIVLRAQAHGEAYYIHPKDLAVYYLKNGDEAYRIMRLYSLGITNKDLSGIPTAELQVK